MSAAELKIQLEGKYEVVEAAASRLELGVKALRASSWASDTVWTELSSLTPAEADAVAALEHKASARGSQAGLALVRRIQKSQLAATKLLSARLTAFGSEAGGNIEERVNRLAQHLPLAFEYDQRRFLAWLAAMIAVVAGVVLVTSWNPIMLLMLLLSGAVFFVGREFGEHIVVTRHALVVDNLAMPLNSVAQVVFEYGARRGCTIDATSRDGAHRQLLVGAAAARDLAKLLRARGVEVKESR